jgi:hypothetical protein
MTSFDRTSRHSKQRYDRWRLLRLGFAVCVPAWTAVGEDALACSCAFCRNAAFIHASATHLPSNARGVLFLKRLPSDGVLDYFSDSSVLVREVALKPLTPSDFAITDDTGHSEPAVLEIVDYDQQLGDKREARRYFRLTDVADEQCYKEHDLPQCAI